MGSVTRLTAMHTIPFIVLRSKQQVTRRIGYHRNVQRVPGAVPKSARTLRNDRGLPLCNRIPSCLFRELMLPLSRFWS